MIDLDKIYTSNNFGEFKIVKYINHSNVYIKFMDTGYLLSSSSSAIMSGSVKDKLSPTICDVGFIGDGDYKTCIKGINTKQYKTWRGMIERCYCPKSLKKNPTYSGCSVSIEWLNFQVFALWFDENYISGYHLDKDIKIKGNKVYSSNACLFVTVSENNIDSHAKRWEFISPYGELVKIYNLAKYCLDNNLNNGCMSSVHRGIGIQHKGWIKA